MILESFFSLLCESRLDDVKVRYPDLTTEIDYLAKNDPSGNQKYLFWAAKMADQGENEREVAYLLADFHEQLSKIQQKDINTYKSLAELETIIDQAEETVSKTQKKQQKKEKGIKKIYEDDRWLVVEPITWEASCIYGRGTKWCISAKDQPQHWPTYKQFGVAFAFIFDKTKEQTDSLYKISVSFYPKEIIEQTREQWEASDDEEKEERLVGLRLQFGGDITYEQMESILYTGAEVYGAENNRLLTQDVQSMLGMDIWNQIQNSVVATERDMPSRQEVEDALQGQGFDLPESVLRQTVRFLLVEGYGFKYREPGPNDIETTLWQNVDVDRIVRELAMRITNAVKGSRNEGEARKRIRGILEKVPGIDSVEVSQAVLRMLGIE